ncbi:MAG: hypothetical protein WB755_12610, partial [Terriglobales bacterium]
LKNGAPFDGENEWIFPLDGPNESLTISNEFSWCSHMKDIHEVLRLKELQISRLEREVAALRVVASLLSDDKEVGNDNSRLRPVRLRRRSPCRFHTQ